MVEMEADEDQELVTVLCDIFGTSRDHDISALRRAMER